MSNFIECKELSKKYSNKEALKNINLILEKGKIYGLIGRNGAGKTTLLSIMSAQNPATSGSVTVEGEEVWENQNALDKICFARELNLTQGNGSSLAGMKIKDYLKLASAYYANWDQKMADELIKKFELEPKKKLGTISKGMLSMVTIIVAMASKATYTFLDEPVAGLDVIMRKQFYELLLSEYEETGRTFVISTHIIEEAANIFEEVIMIKNGELLLKANDIIEKAKKDAEKAKRDTILETKEEIHKLKLELEQDKNEKKKEVKELEDRMLQREKNLDKREELYQKREESLDEKEERLVKKQEEIQNEKVKVEEIKEEQIKLLQEISGISREKAKDMVMKKVEEALSLEIASYIKERENEAKLDQDRKARELLVSSMQKFAGDVASDQTVTVVNLPNDELKGRIIGREGRNIRTIEAVTGVDLIIDDTPEAIVLSSFDPLRREIAKITIETLIKDGRIHPARIEEIYDKTCKDIKEKIMEYGQNALFELGLTKMEPELIELIGKLHFRTSYGQNALKHSIEVAQLSGIMAGEIGENVVMAKRAGLLHDIGKSIDHEIEGSHVEIGADIARKYKENEIVMNAIESHHGDKEATCVIAELVAIADTLSATRPGARNDSLENYVQRLHDLENIANDQKGVENSFAMQAGRELRVIVKPEEISDVESHKVARDIKNRIEEELQYPGTIKVTVIRETRAVEEAK